MKVECETLRKLFGAKRDELSEECRKLHNKGFVNLYPSNSIVMSGADAILRR
jgi:hypothetical protein